jgi:ABC-2 type transport system ATP-binding protein
VRIEVRGLTKRFGSVHALRDVGFDTPAGRRVALIGPNGSGKSTLNRVLMGLLDFDGEVRLDGHSPLRDRVAVAQRMAYVPQIAPTLAVPVGELLRAFGRIRDIPAARLRRIGGELGLDLKELAPKPFRSLSGGMRQKVLIALALASRASLLILDEPTGSLDARSRERFFELFGALAGDATVVLCSHRLEEVRQLVDHVLFLAEGRLVHDGPADAFLASSTTSRVEVSVSGEDPASWLSGLGFRKGTGSWWLRTVTQREKLELIARITGELGPALLDLCVRDLERLDLAAQEGLADDGD